MICRFMRRWALPTNKNLSKNWVEAGYLVAQSATKYPAHHYFRIVTNPASALQLLIISTASDWEIDYCQFIRKLNDSQ